MQRDENLYKTIKYSRQYSFALKFLGALKWKYLKIVVAVAALIIKSSTLIMNLTPFDEARVKM